MFVQKAALRPVPHYAVVTVDAVRLMDARLSDEGRSLQDTLDAVCVEFEQAQPELSSFVSAEISHHEDELSQSVGYFLTLTVYMAFQEAFPTRLGQLSEQAIQAAVDALQADEELRIDDPTDAMSSDDVLAMGQPFVLDFVQKHIREAALQGGDKLSLVALEHVYRTVLVEVIALTDAVARPPNHQDPYGEMSA